MEKKMLLKGKCNFKNKYQSPYKDAIENKNVVIIFDEIDHPVKHICFICGHSRGCEHYKS